MELVDVFELQQRVLADRVISLCSFEYVVRDGKLDDSGPENFIVDFKKVLKNERRKTKNPRITKENYRNKCENLKSLTDMMVQAIYEVFED